MDRDSLRRYEALPVLADGLIRQPASAALVRAAALPALLASPN
jgi:hypothetical protein